MNSLTDIQRERVRGTLLHLERKMRGLGTAYDEHDPSLVTKHTFCDGVYLREISIPKGQLIMGKIHKHAHHNILVSGEVVMITEGGKERIKGYKNMISEAGTKRMLFTLTDVVWITIHKTDMTTAEEAEDDIIAKSYEEIGLDYEAIVTRIEETI